MKPTNRPEDRANTVCCPGGPHPPERSHARLLLTPHCEPLVKPELTNMAVQLCKYIDKYQRLKATIESLSISILMIQFDIALNIMFKNWLSHFTANHHWSVKRIEGPTAGAPVPFHHLGSVRKGVAGVHPRSTGERSGSRNFGASLMGWPSTLVDDGDWWIL